MNGDWTWQLTVVVGALAGSALTMIALGGRHRSTGREQEPSRQEILRELREIEGILDPARREDRDGAVRGGSSPEPIRMTQRGREESTRRAA
jgi:hypothetical protein